jgi:hypothetical protein
MLYDFINQSDQSRMRSNLREYNRFINGKSNSNTLFTTIDGINKQIDSFIYEIGIVYWLSVNENKIQFEKCVVKVIK